MGGAAPGMDESGPAKAHWLTAQRLRVYPQILLAVFLVAVLAYLQASEGLRDPLGKPLGSYFSPFWAGAQLALSGEAEAIYDWRRLLAAQRTLIPETNDVFLWPQPPVFLLLLLPFGLLPYLPGLLAWLSVGYGGFFLALRRYLPAGAGTWALLAFPGAILCALNSQTGLLAAALLGTALIFLERRPVWAGAILGLLGFRPELLLLACLGLIAARQVVALLALLAVLAGTLLVSLLLFGAAPWLAYWNSLSWAAAVVAAGDLPWNKLVSLYGAVRLLGFGSAAGLVLQAAGAALAIAAVVWAWWRPAAYGLKVSVLVCAAFLVSPLMLYYDLVLLALPLLFLAQAGWRGGWGRGERELLVAAWWLPFAASPLAQVASLQVAPLFVLALLGLALRRLQRLEPDRLTPVRSGA